MLTTQVEDCLVNLWQAYSKLMDPRKGQRDVHVSTSGVGNPTESAALSNPRYELKDGGTRTLKGTYTFAFGRTRAALRQLERANQALNEFFEALDESDPPPLGMLGEKRISEAEHKRLQGAQRRRRQLQGYGVA